VVSDATWEAEQAETTLGWGTMTRTSSADMPHHDLAFGPASRKPVEKHFAPIIKVADTGAD